MRELDKGVADAMRTSSQTEAENYDLDFSDVINQAFADTESAPEFGHSNPNHLEEPPRRESCEDTPKVKQINIHIDLDLYKLLVPAAAIAGVAILTLGYRKQDKLIGGLKAIKNQLKSIKKD